jgi:hypothetical protein
MNVSHTITGGLVHLSDNPIQVVLSCAGSLPNHRLALKISCPELVGSPFIEEIAPRNGVSIFEIQGYFGQPMKPEFHFPVTGVASAHGSLVFNATIDTGEVFTDENGDRVESWNNISTNHQIRVIKGKLRPNVLGILNDQGKSFASEYIEGGKFLTNIRNNSVVSPNQIVKLWYLSRWNQTHTATLRIEVENTSDFLPIFSYQQEVVLYTETGLLELSINHRLLGFNIPPTFPPGTLATAFTVWLEDSVGDISERLRFVIDNKFYENEFFLFYQNPFHVIESYWLTGEHSENLKTENEIAVRELPALTGSKTAGIIVLSASGTRSWSINTGYKSQEEIAMIRDVLESRNTWLINQEDLNGLVPVVVEAGDFELYKSDWDIPNLSLTIREACL